jgi:hypothetical protein
MLLTSSILIIATTTVTITIDIITIVVMLLDTIQSRLHDNNCRLLEI